MADPRTRYGADAHSSLPEVVQPANGLEVVPSDGVEVVNAEEKELQRRSAFGHDAPQVLNSDLPERAGSFKAEEDAENPRGQSRRRKRLIWIVVIVVLVSALALGVGLGVGLHNDQSSGYSSTQEPCHVDDGLTCLVRVKRRLLLALVHNITARPAHSTVPAYHQLVPSVQGT